MVDRILNLTLFRTVSWVEAYWLAVALIGIAIGWVNISEARSEQLRMRNNNINGIGEAVASTSIKGDISRVIEMSCCLAIGIFSALTPPLHTLELTGFHWWSRVATIGALLVIEGLIIGNIILIRHNRVSVLRMYDAMHSHRGELDEAH